MLLNIGKTWTEEELDLGRMHQRQLDTSLSVACLTNRILLNVSSGPSDSTDQLGDNSNHIEPRLDLLAKTNGERYR